MFFVLNVAPQKLIDGENLAEVMKLADMQRSERCGRKLVRVQIPPSAL